MTVWKCTSCSTVVTWIFDGRPGCPYCGPRGDTNGLMQRVDDAPA